MIFTVEGFSFSGSGQNAGMAFVSLKNWSERKGEENTARAIALRATQELSTIRDATIFAMTPPAVDGLGQSNGFTFELMASGGTDRDALLKLRNQLIGEANQTTRCTPCAPTICRRCRSFRWISITTKPCRWGSP